MHPPSVRPKRTQSINFRRQDFFRLLFEHLKQGFITLCFSCFHWWPSPLLRRLFNLQSSARKLKRWFASRFFFAEIQKQQFCENNKFKLWESRVKVFCSFFDARSQTLSNNPRMKLVWSSIKFTLWKENIFALFTKLRRWVFIASRHANYSRVNC